MKPNWTTREGKRIHVSEMSDSHAQNTLNMIIKQNGAKKILTAILSLNEQANKKPSEKWKPNGEIAEEHHDKWLTGDFCECCDEDPMPCQYCDEFLFQAKP